MQPSSSQINYPSFFWKVGPRPIKFSFLSDYPHGEKGSYAVYLNEQTKLPERIYIEHITDRHLNYSAVLNDCLHSTLFATTLLLDRMIEDEIDFDDKSILLLNRCFAAKETHEVNKGVGQTDMVEIEVNHIFETGANEIRVVEMVNRLLDKQAKLLNEIEAWLSMNTEPNREETAALRADIRRLFKENT